MISGVHIKRLPSTLANSMGFDFVAKWKMPHLPLARHLTSLFELYEVDCVFDVGANVGQYRDFLRDICGFDGWILSFEPVRAHSEQLATRAKSDSRWRIFDFALGSESGERKINVTKWPSLESFLAPRSDIVKSFWGRDSIVSEETVKIVRLDQILDGLKSEIGFACPYLKLDTQGFDWEVVRRAASMIEQFAAMQTEASVRPIYTGMPTYKDMLAQLDDIGFDLSGVFPVSTDNALRLVEFDAVLVRRAVAVRLE